MNKGALALLIHGGTENWSPERWKRRFDEVCADRRVCSCRIGVRSGRGPLRRGLEARAGRTRGVSEPARHFQSRRRRRCADGRFEPADVPLVRVAVGDLTGRMTEYVVLHALMHHRQELYLRACQRERRWEPRMQWPASAVTVGVMGLGTLGADAAEACGVSAFAWRAGAAAPGRSRASNAFTARGSSMRSCSGPISWSACCR